MSKPDKVIVMGKEFTVNYPKRIASGHYGYTLPDQGQIKINSKLEGRELTCTLFHEMAHAALHVAGLTQILDDKTEEAVIRAIENGIGHYIELNCLKDE